MKILKFVLLLKYLFSNIIIITANNKYCTINNKYFTANNKY